MVRLIIPLIIVGILAGGVFNFYQGSLNEPAMEEVSTPSPTSEVNASASPQPKADSGDVCDVLVNGNQDVPPLYRENIVWSEPLNVNQEVTEYEDVSLGKGFSTKKVDGCKIDATTSSSIAGELRKFYIKKLQDKDWGLVDAADGPDGFYVVYKRGSKHLSMKLINDRLELFYGY